MKNLLDQPKGLLPLCFTELWERFGYYFLQVIFVLFLTQSMDFSQRSADLLFGAFAALLYVTPTAGGWLADHYLGFRRAILIGAILLFVGYAILMFSERLFFYIGLAFLIVGNGFFKPNVSSIVGELYGEDEARREGGFTLFYMGINIGSLIPPLIAFSVIQHWGWHLGFGLAAFGMLLSFFNFIYCTHRVAHIGNPPPARSVNTNPKKRISFHVILACMVVLALALLAIALLYPEQTGKIVIFAAIVYVLTVLFYLYRANAEYRAKMLASLILIILSIVFWALYSESFTVLMFFASSNMNKHLMGATISPEFTQFYNCFFIILLSPFLNYFWQWLARYGCNPSIPLKFAYGIGLMGLGYVLLSYATNGNFGHAGVISGWWLIGSYLLQTLGELFLSPIGLAMITVLSPKNLVGMMMGVWFFALAAASSVSGFLATVAAIPKQATAVQGLSIFHHAFSQWSWISLFATAVAFLCYPILKRMISTS